MGLVRHVRMATCPVTTRGRCPKVPPTGRSCISTDRHAAAACGRSVVASCEVASSHDLPVAMLQRRQMIYTCLSRRSTSDRVPSQVMRLPRLHDIVHMFHVAGTSARESRCGSVSCHCRRVRSYTRLRVCAKTLCMGSCVRCVTRTKPEGPVAPPGQRRSTRTAQSTRVRRAAATSDPPELRSKSQQAPGYPHICTYMCTQHPASARQKPTENAPTHPPTTRMRKMCVLQGSRWRGGQHRERCVSNMVDVRKASQESDG